MTAPAATASLLDMTVASAAPPLPRTLGESGLAVDLVHQLLI